MSEWPISPLMRLGWWGLVLLPGGLTIFLSFNGGGFFPGTPALVAVILMLVLASRIIVAPHPFAGFSPALAVAAGALGLYALWTGLSAVWSDSAWRALVEFNRVLLYLTALILFGSVARDPRRMRWMVRGVAGAILAVCTIGLLTRLLPELWPTEPNLDPSRLSYPITYWNTLGLMASIGTILCLHLTSSRSEPWQLRAAGAGALPVLVTCLYFTLSRGAIVAGAIGLVTYMVLGRPRALLSGLLATVPTATIAVALAYRADELVGSDPTSSAAIAQGHDVVLAVGLCVAGAVGLRLALLALDARTDRLRLPSRVRKPVLWSTAAAAVVSLVVPVAALDAPEYVSDQYDRFLDGTGAGDPSDARTRLTDPGSNGRIDAWRVAVNDGFNQSELHGQGADTFELVWTEYRPQDLAGLTIDDAHSLYVETLSDLGLVGLLLVLTFVVTILYGFAARLRGPRRTLYAALFAAGLAWALHAGVDWDWEMPAVTLWLFALGGAALAARSDGPQVRFSPPLALRAAISGALVLLAIVPALTTVSQGRLDDAAEAFLRSGDCPTVIEEARGATAVLPIRPEPYRLQGYCEARLGQTGPAVQSMLKAVARDPHNWEYHYALAVAQAAAGMDPSAATNEALRLNPLGAATLDLESRFRSTSPRALRRQAAALLDGPVF